MTERIKEKENPKVLWFSRHTPTEEQIQEFRGRGLNLVVTSKATYLANMKLNTDGDVKACLTALLAECASTGSTTIAGVFATPIAHQLFRTTTDIIQRGAINDAHSGNGDYLCVSSWSTARAEEGERPIFEHKEFLPVGYLSQASLRWL